MDNKKIFFGCSLDGDSAFEVVNRDIHTRELYCAGEAITTSGREISGQY